MLRLLNGFLRFSISFFIIIFCTQKEGQNEIWYFLYKHNLSFHDIKEEYGWVFIIPALILVYQFIRGWYYMTTEAPLPVWEGSSSKGVICEKEEEFENIQSVLRYRESLMSTMSNEKASKEYMKTAWVEGFVNNSGNTKNAVSFLNSKLATMSNEEGYKYLKEENK